MTRTSCFNSERSLHDRRFRRKMSGWEFRDFVVLLWFASAECLDPALIPARKMGDLAMELGMTGQLGKERLAQRLDKWADLDLIQREEDGGLQINFVMDQEEDEDEVYKEEGYDLAPYMPSVNMPSVNGNGSNGNGHIPARKSSKPYSNNPASVRKRELRNKQKMQQQGYSQAGTFSQNVPANVPAAESECPDYSPAMSQEVPLEMSQKNGTFDRDIPGTSRARNVQNVVGGLKESYNSEYVSNVATSKNVPPNVPTQNVPPINGNPPKVSLKEKALKAAPPPPRPPIHPSQVPATRQSEVRMVMQEIGDETNWKPFWMNLWNHCHKNDLLRCWDEGFAIYLYRLKVSPPTGPGSIKVGAKFLRGTIRNLLATAGAPYVTQAEAQADSAAQEPVDDEEMAEIRRMVAETKAQWDKDAQASQNALSAVITPLEDIMPGAEAEMEDE